MSQAEDRLRHTTDQILQGIRIVLPGTQALMGFQFIAFFNPVFQALPMFQKRLHFASLLLTIMCTLLLIAPVAFQQIGEDGTPTKRFIEFTKKMLSAAMFLLLLAIAGDVYLAARVIGVDGITAGIAAGVLFIAGFFLWYVYALFKRQRSD